MLIIHRNNKHYYESVNGGEPACIDEQLPFDIPDSWEWTRLFTYCQYGEAPGIKGSECPPEGCKEPPRGVPSCFRPWPMPKA